MQTQPIPAGAQPASAFAVIQQRLESLGVFASTPLKSDAEHFVTAGTCFMQTAANLVAAISTDKRLNRENKGKAGHEALKFAALSDLCMRRAAELSTPVQPEGGK